MSAKTEVINILIKARFQCETLPDTATHLHRFEIGSTSSSRKYVVAKRRFGGWECGCRGWTTRRYCKHLTRMEPALTKAFG